MGTNKPRRLLTETELLSIVESSEEELSQAESKLGPIANQILDGIYEPGTFVRLIKSGAFEASTVHVDKEPAFVMIYTRNALGWLTVEGVASLAKKASFKYVFDAGDALARHYGCKTIQFVTKLSSLYRYGLEQGYKSLGVIMCKDASPA